MRHIIIACTLLLASVGSPAAAQDSENGAILTWIEESISTPGRMISIRGVEGALSSSARIAEITISDADGVWLQLLGAQIDWRRSALFSGRLEIDNLQAAQINFLRKPLPIETAPTPEARGFSLPELPVDIQIANISTAEIILGESIIGIEARLSLAAALTLNGDGLSADLTATRLDGPGGEVALHIGYARETTLFSIDTTVNEPQGGVIANALNLDGAPALAAQIAGEGILDNLSVTLGVDVGQARLIDGQVRLADHADGRSLALDLRGQISAFLPKAYRPFFEGESAITARGVLREAGGMRLEQLSATTADMQIEGSLDTADDGFPRRANLDITIARANGTPVTLPFGDAVALERASLSLQYGVAQNGRYALDYSAQNLVIPGFDIAEISGAASGLALNLDDPENRAISGSFTGALSGVQPVSDATAQALGREISLSAAWDWATGARLTLQSAKVEAQGLALAAKGAFSGISFIGQIEASVADLTAFSALAGREIAGQISLSADGQLPLIGGEVDVELAATGVDLQLSQPQFDALFAGASTISGHFVRNEVGLELGDFVLSSPLAMLNLDARLSSAALSLTGHAALSDIAPLIAELSGPAELGFNATGPYDAITLAARLSTELGATAQVEGLIGTALDVNARFDQLPLGAMSSFAPELGIAGTGAGQLHLTGRIANPSLDFSASVAGFGAAQVQTFGLPLLDISASGTATRPQVTLDAAEITGDNGLSLQLTGDLALDMSAFDLRASFANLPLDASATIAPALGLSGSGSGQLHATGSLDAPNVEFTAMVDRFGAAMAQEYGLPLLGIRASGSANSQRIHLDSAEISGNGAVNMQLAGDLSLDLSAMDLRAAGQLPLSLSRAVLESSGIGLTGQADFVLGVTGAVARPVIDGRVSTNGASLYAPAYRVRLDNLDLRANLAGDAVTITNATADFQGGGQVSLQGRLGLGAGFPATLEAELQNLSYSDGEMFTTTLNASLALTGPVARSPQLAGQVTLLNTEIQIPSSFAAADIPDITHINVPRPVRRTQQRAGIDADGGRTGAPFSMGLDIAVASPGPIFVRGRGLDAELGGTLRVTGNSNAPTTTGRFDLERGRMDLLGQRLTFTQGSARMQGSLMPLLDLRAETRTNDYTIGLQLVGPADALEIILSSSPELPQDEVLAQLIFSRGMDALSPFQIAQLASSLAELSGRSSGGIISRLREASGLDNLDIQTAGGATSVTAGSYLQDNLYSEVELNDQGDASLSINIDIIDGLRGRATQGSGGDTSIGIYFERDY